MKEHHIEKLDVVRRQISEAVRLFFEKRDPVVIHTVIASAHQILFDLGESRGIASSIKNTATLKGEDLKRFLRLINDPYNFFKHANRDPEAKIDIGPLEEFTQDFIMDAIVMLQRISGCIPFEAKIYWFWFVSKYPGHFSESPPDGAIKGMQAEELARWDFPTICNFLKSADLMEDTKELS